MNQIRTIAQAVARSRSHNEIVRVEIETRDLNVAFREAGIEFDDAVEIETDVFDVWGSDPSGPEGDWRLTVFVGQED